MWWIGQLDEFVLTYGFTFYLCVPFKTHLGSEHLSVHLIKQWKCAGVRDFRVNEGSVTLRAHSWMCVYVCVCVYVVTGETGCSGMAQKCVYICCCQNPVRRRPRTPTAHYIKPHYATLYTTLYTTLHYITHVRVLMCGISNKHRFVPILTSDSHFIIHTPFL